jgi:hypothetical protein
MTDSAHKLINKIVNEHDITWHPNHSGMASKFKGVCPLEKSLGGFDKITKRHHPEHEEDWVDSQAMINEDLPRHAEINDFNDAVNSPKQIPNKTTASMGISAKTVYRPTEKNNLQSTYMVKPFHRNPEVATKGWVQYPIMGWATMTNHALYEAAGIGDMNEKVYINNVHGVPSVIHKFEPNAQDHINFSANGNHKAGNYSIDDKTRAHYNKLAKIAVMDYLSENQDRHRGNIMYKYDPEGTPVAIDHERSFQYIDDGRRNRQSSAVLSRLDGLSDWKGKNTGPLSVYEVNEPDSPHVWWQSVRDNVHAAFHKKLKHIKNPELKQRLEENFNERVENLDAWASGNYEHLSEIPSDREAFYNPPKNVIQKAKKLKILKQVGSLDYNNPRQLMEIAKSPSYNLLPVATKKKIKQHLIFHTMTSPHPDMIEDVANGVDLENRAIPQYNLWENLQSGIKNPETLRRLGASHKLPYWQDRFREQANLLEQQQQQSPPSSPEQPK